jgi:SAM-dependent methyltransferase
LEQVLLRSKQTIIDSYNQIHSQTEKLLEMPSFYEWILNQLSVTSKKTLLDVATGSGQLLRNAILKGVSVVGIDISIKAIQKAREVNRCPNLVLCDGEKLPFKDKCFDYVTNIGSLEHFLNPVAGIEEMFRVLNDSGKAAIFLPNSYYLGDILTKVLLFGDGPSHNQAVDRFAAKNEWAAFIEQNGFTINKIIRYNFLFPRKWKDVIYLKSRPRRILGILLSPFIPFNFSYSFLFICKKSIS